MKREEFSKSMWMDASGRLGSSLVETLLQRNYIVHAAHLHLVAMQRIERVFCFVYSFETPQEQPIFDVRAAHNVIEACAQTDTMEKVVFTSSVTTVIWREDHKSTTADELSERDWSDVNFYQKIQDVNMVSINAGLLVGPDIPMKTPYLRAAEMYEDGVLVTVDLKFLVDAHICVYEDISSYGRYLCFNHVVNRPDDAVEFAKMLTPSSATTLSAATSQKIWGSLSKDGNKKLNKLMVDCKN
ncbi:hypothetical protein MKW92_009965 [Papaver armeniacum]|nr:hypothetical protein MKW92_009965 [Papaver armeniacum]